MKPRELTLNSGAVLRYEKNVVSNITLIEISFNCGSRCNTIDGLAHFCEHMFFTGTKDMSKEEITKKYYDFMDVNAYTGYTDITFHGNILNKDVDSYFACVAKMITESTFTQAQVDKEIPVVLQEIARSEDKFEQKSRRFDFYNMTKLESYKNGNLGTPQSVKSITSKDVKDFVKKYFIANNMEVFISSPLSFGRIKRALEKNLANKLPINKKFKPLPMFYNQLGNDNYYAIKTQKINKAYMYVNLINDHNLFDVEYSIKLAFVRHMMNNIAEGVMKKVRLEKSLTYGASFRSNFFEKFSTFCFFTQCDGKNMKEILKTVAEYLENLKKTGFTQSQFDNESRRFAFDKAKAEPTASAVFRDLYDIRTYKRVYSIKWEGKIIKKITLDECNAILRDLLSNSKVSASFYGDITAKDLPTKAEFKKLFSMCDNI